MLLKDDWEAFDRRLWTNIDAFKDADKYPLYLCGLFCNFAEGWSFWELKSRFMERLFST